MAKLIQIIYFDFDGVLAISPPEGRVITDSLSTILKIPASDVKRAFKECGNPFLLGQQSLNVFLENFSNKLGKTVNQKDLEKAYLLVPVNKPLLGLIRKLRKNYSIELVSNNPKFRFDILKNKGVIDIWREFDKVFISSYLKKFKEDFFHEVCNLQHGLFVDNNPGFLAEVKSAGGTTLYYDATKHSIKYLKEYLQKTKKKRPDLLREKIN